MEKYMHISIFRCDKGKESAVCKLLFLFFVSMNNLFEPFGGSISGFPYFILFFGLFYVMSTAPCWDQQVPVGPVTTGTMVTAVHHAFASFSVSILWMQLKCMLYSKNQGWFSHTHASHKATYVKSNFLKAKYLGKWLKINKSFQKVFVGGMFDHSTINIWRWQTEVY